MNIPVINLFSSSFSGPSSTAYATPQHFEYVRGQMDWDGLTVFVDGFINDPAVDQVNSRYKVGWLHEPQCLYPTIYADSVNHLSKFDKILTYHQPLLELDSRYHFAPYGGVWIPRDRWGLAHKTKRVSMLYGDKTAATGHRLRHIIGAQLGDRYGVDYYGSVRGVPTDYSWQTKQQVHAPYRFSIVVETCYEANLFTEILLDCIACGTIPILWGCPNIADFFNPKGVLLLDEYETVLDLMTLLPRLTGELYHAMLPAARENLGLLSQYAVTDDWLWEHHFKEYFL